MMLNIHQVMNDREVMNRYILDLTDERYTHISHTTQ